MTLAFSRQKGAAESKIAGTWSCKPATKEKGLHAARGVSTGGTALVKGTQPGLADSRYPSLSTTTPSQANLLLATQMPVGRTCLKIVRRKQGKDS